MQTTMVQVRNVPVEVHRTLKARAALAGMTLSDFVLAELIHVVERPTRAELVERVRKLERVVLSEDAATALRAERDFR